MPCLIAVGFLLFYGSAVVDTKILGNLPTNSKPRKATVFTLFGGLAICAIGLAL